jgi:hypothetical protein
MKSKIIIIFFALALTACKTTSGPVGQVSTRRHREFPEPSFAEFAQPTNQRDTLYLVKGDSMSILTAKIWESDDTTRVRPKIIMVTKEDMVCIKNRCNKTNKNKSL